MQNARLEFQGMVDLNCPREVEFKSLQIPSYVSAKNSTNPKATVETLDKQGQSANK